MNTFLKPVARVLAHRFGDRGRRQIPGPQPDDVDGGAGREQVGHRAGVGGDTGCVVHRDGGQQGVGGGGREADLFGDIARQPRRGEGEVGVAGGVHQTGVVQQGAGEQQLGVDVCASSSPSARPKR